MAVWAVLAAGSTLAADDPKDPGVHRGTSAVFPLSDVQKTAAEARTVVLMDG